MRLSPPCFISLFTPVFKRSLPELRQLRYFVCVLEQGSTVQPWAALGRIANATQDFPGSGIAGAQVRRANALCSLSDDELSAAALATRVCWPTVHARWCGQVNGQAFC